MSSTQVNLEHDLITRYDPSVSEGDLKCQLENSVRSAVQIERPILTPQDYARLASELSRTRTLLSERPTKEFLPKSYVLKNKQDLWLIVQSQTNLIISYAPTAKQGEQEINSILDAIENLFGPVSIHLLDLRYKILIRNMLIKENTRLAITMFGASLSIVLFVNTFIQQLSLEFMIGVPLVASAILTLILSKKEREVAPSRI